MKIRKLNLLFLVLSLLVGQGISGLAESATPSEVVVEAPSIPPVVETTPETSETTTTPAPITTEAPSAQEEDGEQEDAPSETQAPQEENVMAVSIAWKLQSTNSILGENNEVTLNANLGDTEEGTYIWQVLTNPANTSGEQDTQWQDVPNETKAQYTFVAKDNMKNWKWRVCAITSDGQSIYSNEISLPEGTTEEAVPDFALPESADEESGANDTDTTATPSEATSAPAATAGEATPLLPSAEIRVMTDAPNEEIQYGTQITLTATILHPVDGMTLQWQYLHDEDEAWIEVEGANEAEYSFVMNEENEGKAWRVLITLP